MKETKKHRVTSWRTPALGRLAALATLVVLQLFGYYWHLPFATVQAFSSPSSSSPSPPLPRKNQPPLSASSSSLSSDRSRIGATQFKEKNVASLTANQKALDEGPPFPRTWVPLASVYELNPDRPTAVTFLNQEYVIFKDNSDRWAVFDNSCPHRMAPLSEGRVDRTTVSAMTGKAEGLLECSYHGWVFNSSGDCQRIPQVTEMVQAAAFNNPKCHAHSYPVQIHKQLLFVWPWPEDPLSVLLSDDPQFALNAVPEGILANVRDNLATITRDLPYGWDTLVENIVDPAHVPWAHHGLQGKRDDAVPINMTVYNITKAGFQFYMEDQTMGQYRKGGAEYRAPFVAQYDASFEGPGDRKFNLTVVMVPTKPGWSRTFIFGRPVQSEKKEAAKKTTTKARVYGPKQTLRTALFIKIAGLFPMWVIHILQNRFLDSDLAFLHYQEQNKEKRGLTIAASNGYFMPAMSDRSISAFRRWIKEYAHIPGPLPPAITDRSVLFDRWAQHGDNCRHCSAALAGIQKWRKNTYLMLAFSVLLAKHTFPRIVAVSCILVLRLLAAAEKPLKTGGFDHYKNH